MGRAWNKPETNKYVTLLSDTENLLLQAAKATKSKRHTELGVSRGNRRQ